MDTSLFLAQFFGLYFVIVGIAMLVRFKLMTELMTKMASREFIYLSGFVTLLMGIPLVLLHNVWDGSWRVIITILAWITLFKGISRIFFPEVVAGWSKKIFQNTKSLQFLLWILIIFGLYLLYIGLA